MNAPDMGATLQVNVMITYTGSEAGKEVTELYISSPAIKLDKHSSEHDTFTKPKILQPGES